MSDCIEQELSVQDVLIAGKERPACTGSNPSLSGNGPEGDALDTQAMARLAAGQDVALNELMQRHAQRLFRYLVRSLQNESDAADLSQETFVRVYQHRHRFDSRLRFSTWLYTIASNLVRSRYRWRSRHPQVSLDASNQETGTGLAARLPDGRTTPSESLEGTERADAVRQAIASLPEDLRLPLVLAEYEEKSQAEIAQILHCTVKAVETRIYRARRRLRELLRPWLEASGAQLRCE